MKDVHVKSLIVHDKYILGRFEQPWNLREERQTLEYNVIKVEILSVVIIFSHSRGVWNSPFISSIYLIQKQVLNEMQGSFGPSEVDPDMAMCHYLRNRVSISTCSVHEGTMI